MKDKGIPDTVLRELNINEVEKIEDAFQITAVVEKHQVKLPVPSELRRELVFKKGQKLKLKFDPKNKTLTYQL